MVVFFLNLWMMPLTTLSAPSRYVGRCSRPQDQCEEPDDHDQGDNSDNCTQHITAGPFAAEREGPGSR